MRSGKQNLYSSICGTIGIAAAVALKYFGMDKVMVCDHSDFRLKLAAGLGCESCNTANENFASYAKSYFGTAPSLRKIFSQTFFALAK